jgi:hypothetical protein
MQDSDRASLLTMAELKARGWNQHLVGRFLGEPNLYSNPGFKAGRPARLYSSERVHLVERGQPDFGVERERSREMASQRGTLAQRKQRSLLEVAHSIELPQLAMTYSALLACVCNTRPNAKTLLNVRLHCDICLVP